MDQEAQQLPADGNAGPEPVVKLIEPKVEPTELAYVTAVDKGEKKFFVQQCKYTNKDLTDFNRLIHNKCARVNGPDNDKAKSPPTVVAMGDIFCTKYSRDGYWYRVQVKKVDEEKRECDVFFVDYGNAIDELSFDYLLRLDPKDFPEIGRIPFGFFCKLNGLDRFSEELQSLLLDCVMEEYILIKIVESLGPQERLINIPKLAYNSAFWLSFENKRPNKMPVGGLKRPNVDLVTN